MNDRSYLGYGHIEDCFDEPICECGHYRVCHHWVFPESATVTSFAPPGSYKGGCGHCNCGLFRFETTHEMDAARAREKASNERILFVVLVVAAILLAVMLTG